MHWNINYAGVTYTVFIELKVINVDFFTDNNNTLVNVS